VGGRQHSRPTIRAEDARRRDLFDSSKPTSPQGNEALRHRRGLCSACFPDADLAPALPIACASRVWLGRPAWITVNWRTKQGVAAQTVPAAGALFPETSIFGAACSDIEAYFTSPSLAGHASPPASAGG
jgi:hypothetical protein